MIDSRRVDVRIIREGKFWLAIPEEVAGGFSGESLSEVRADTIEGLTWLFKDDPRPVEITWSYELPELNDELTTFFEHQTRLQRLEKAYNETAADLAKKLTQHLALSVRDAAELMKMSKSRIQQLAHKE